MWRKRRRHVGHTTCATKWSDGGGEEGHRISSLMLNPTIIGAETFGEEIRQAINKGKTSGHLRTGLGQVSFRWKSKLSWQTFRHRTWFCYAPTYTASRLFHASFSLPHTFICAAIIQGVFFSCSSFFSVPKWKTCYSQQELLFEEFCSWIAAQVAFILALSEKKEEWLKKMHFRYFVKHSPTTFCF